MSSPLWPDDIDAPLWPDDIDAPAWDDVCCCGGIECSYCVYYFNITGADYGNYEYYLERVGESNTYDDEVSGFTATMEYDPVLEIWTLTITDGICEIVWINETTTDECPGIGTWVLDSNTCGGDPVIYAEGAGSFLQYADYIDGHNCSESYTASIGAGAVDCVCEYDGENDEWVLTTFTFSSQDITLSRVSGTTYSGTMSVSRRVRRYAGVDGNCDGTPISDTTTTESYSVVLYLTGTAWYLALQLQTVLGSPCGGDLTGDPQCCPEGTYTGGGNTVVVS